MLIDREVVSSTFEQATTRNSQVAKTFIAARGLPYHILHTVPGTVVISLYQAVCRKLIFAVRGTISTDWYVPICSLSKNIFITEDKTKGHI